MFTHPMFTPLLLLNEVLILLLYLFANFPGFYFVIFFTLSHLSEFVFAMLDEFFKYSLKQLIQNSPFASKFVDSSKASSDDRKIKQIKK